MVGPQPPDHVGKVLGHDALFFRRAGERKELASVVLRENRAGCKLCHPPQALGTPPHAKAAHRRHPQEKKTQDGQKSPLPTQEARVFPLSSQCSCFGSPHAIFRARRSQPRGQQSLGRATLSTGSAPAASAPQRGWGTHGGTHRSGGIPEVNLQVPHGLDDGHDGLDCVAVDHGFVLPALLLRVAIFVDDPGGRGQGQALPRAWCQQPGASHSLFKPGKLLQLWHHRGQTPRTRSVLQYPSSQHHQLGAFPRAGDSPAAPTVPHQGRGRPQQPRSSPSGIGFHGGTRHSHRHLSSPPPLTACNEIFKGQRSG